MKFRFTVTRNTTESTTVEVEADSIEEAHIKGLSVPNVAVWEPDECVHGEPYIPDEGDYEVIE